jgi:hypothetical protein
MAAGRRFDRLTELSFENGARPDSARGADQRGRLAKIDLEHDVFSFEMPPVQTERILL